MIKRNVKVDIMIIYNIYGNSRLSIVNQNKGWRIEKYEKYTWRGCCKAITIRERERIIYYQI